MKSAFAMRACIQYVNTSVAGNSLIMSGSAMEIYSASWRFSDFLWCVLEWMSEFSRKYSSSCRMHVKSPPKNVRRKLIYNQHMAGTRQELGLFSSVSSSSTMSPFPWLFSQRLRLYGEFLSKIDLKLYRPQWNQLKVKGLNKQKTHSFHIFSPITTNIAVRLHLNSHHLNIKDSFQFNIISNTQ